LQVFYFCFSLVYSCFTENNSIIKRGIIMALNTNPPLSRYRIHKDPKKLEGGEKQAARAVDQFVAACGGVAMCARFLGVSKQHVQQWRQRQAIGRFWAELLDNVPSCGAAGFTKEYFRPDLTHDEWLAVRTSALALSDREERLAHMNGFWKKLPNA